MLRVACVVEGTGMISEEKSVIVFQAAGPHAAKQRIIDISRKREERYVNVDGQRVRWTVREIMTLDWLEEGPDLGDEREVYSRIEDLPEPDHTVAFDADYPLDAAEPRQTGV
jgi:hypothetical protein